MKFFLAFSAFVAVALAKPGFLNGLNGHAAVVAPLAYTQVVPGAPIGPDGRVVDTPEVAVAKAEHTAAHINEKVNLANEAVRSADLVAYPAPAVVSTYATPGVISAPLTYPVLAAGAPIGADGRVVDTPEVAVAKAAHAAAHINEKVTLVNEATRNYAAYSSPAIVSTYGAPVLTAAGVYPAAAPGLAHQRYLY